VDKSLRCKYLGEGWLLRLRGGLPGRRDCVAPRPPSGQVNIFPVDEKKPPETSLPLPVLGPVPIPPPESLLRLPEGPLNAAVVRVSGWGKPPEKAAYLVPPSRLSCVAGTGGCVTGRSGLRSGWARLRSRWDGTECRVHSGQQGRRLIGRLDEGESFFSRSPPDPARSVRVYPPRSILEEATPIVQRSLADLPHMLG